MAGSWSIKKVRNMFYHSCQIYTVQSIIFVLREKHKTGGDLRSFCFRKPPPDLLEHTVYFLLLTMIDSLFAHFGLFWHILFFFIYFLTHTVEQILMFTSPLKIQSFSRFAIHLVYKSPLQPKLSPTAKASNHLSYIDFSVKAVDSAYWSKVWIT